MKGIYLEHIKKSFIGKHPVLALDDISLEVKPGELFGLIGPYGAGKTTLFRIITTLLLADKGQGYLGDFELQKNYLDIRKIIGYMPGKFSLYQDLTIEENLHFFATLFNTTLAANYDLIKEIYVQLEPFKHRRAGKLSGGMKQKLALCCALIHKPEILLLDEPTTGVDPVSRKEFWEMLGRLKAQGITILVSTPYMDEAILCDRIALIQEGQLLSVDTPQGIIDNYDKPLYAITGEDLYSLLGTLRSYEGTASCFGFGDALHLTLKKEFAGIELIEQYLQTKHIQGVNISEITPGIEDCFMAYM